jgi:4-amino-4-deoxy-L-arabinose transferase-like glycosyltransferase
MKSQQLPEAPVKAYSFFAIPIVWSCTGLALTEIPAVCLYSAHLCFLFRGIHSKNISQIGWALLSGACLGLAILGRQPLLLVLLGLAYLGVTQKHSRSVIGIVFLIALIFCLPVFFLWQGLVPPTTASVARGFSVSHVFVGLYFSAIIFLILCPKWLILDPKIVVPLLVGCTLLNIVLDGESVLPVIRITSKLIPEQFSHFIGQIWIGGLRGLGIIFIFSFCRQLYQNRKDSIRTFLWLSAFSQILAMGAVTHQTSNRYLMTAVPAFILLSGFYPSDKYRLPRFFFGASLGALILISHLRDSL